MTFPPNSGILYVEKCPGRDVSYHYTLDGDKVIKVPSAKVLGTAEASSSSEASRLFLFFRSVFLPAGFPHSVSRDYVAYQTWDTVQAFASSISSSLATRVWQLDESNKVYNKPYNGSRIHSSLQLHIQQ